MPIAKGGTGATTAAAALEALGGRTKLYENTGSSLDWSAVFGTVSFTVTDIDNFDYITLNIRERQNTNVPWRYDMGTVPRRFIPTDSTPGVAGSDANVTLLNGISMLLTIGRSAAGTTLYLKPQASVYAQVLAIWGGDF